MRPDRERRGRTHSSSSQHVHYDWTCGGTTLAYGTAHQKPFVETVSLATTGRQIWKWENYGSTYKPFPYHHDLG